MKIRTRKTTFASLVFLLAALLTGGYLVQQQVLAATGQIYLSPASTSVANGNNVQLNLRINPAGTPVDSVQATINFDSTKLKYISFDTSGSAFGTNLQQTVGSNSVTISRGDFSGGVSVDSLVAAITFQSLVYSGSTSVTLTSANASAAGQGTYTNPSVANASVTLTAGSCPSGQTGTPPNCTTVSTGGGGSSSGGGTSGGTGSTGSGGTGKTGSTGTTKNSGGTSTTTTTTTPTGATVPTTGAPKPSVTSVKVGFSSLDTSFTTTEATQVYLAYGVTPDLAYQTAADTAGTTHSFSLDQSVILPGQTYYFRAVSRSSSGTLTLGDIQKITAKGMAIKIKVVDKNSKPLAGKKVTLHSDPATTTTDKNGYATFSNVTPANHQLIYAPGKNTYSKQLTVANNVTVVNGEETAPLQNFSVVYNVTQPTLASKLLPIVIFIVVAALAFYIYRSRQKTNGGIGGHPLDPDLVVVGGAGQAVEPVTPDPVVQPQAQPMPQNVPTGFSEPAPTAAPTPSPAPEPVQPKVSEAFLTPPPPAQPSSVVTPNVSRIEVK